MGHVIVERRFPNPIDLDELAVTARNNQGCLARHDVRYLYGYVAPERQRMICVYAAPDAESVRIVNRQIALPYERAYGVSLHEPPDVSPSAPSSGGGTLVDVLVERSFPEPMRFDDLQEIENRGLWCLDEHGVRFVRSYFSLDRQRMLCRYVAADAEAVRIVNRRLGMPFDAAWAITQFNV